MWTGYRVSHNFAVIIFWQQRIMVSVFFSFFTVVILAIIFKSWYCRSEKHLHLQMMTLTSWTFKVVYLFLSGWSQLKAFQAQRWLVYCVVDVRWLDECVFWDQRLFSVLEIHITDIYLDNTPGTAKMCNKTNTHHHSWVFEHSMMFTSVATSIVRKKVPDWLTQV